MELIIEEDYRKLECRIYAREQRGSQVVKLKMANNYNTYWKVPALGKPLEKVDVETKVLYSS